MPSATTSWNFNPPPETKSPRKADLARVSYTYIYNAYFVSDSKICTAFSAAPLRI